MDEQEIAQLELFCKQLYESPDPSIRSAAEKALILFAGSPDCLSKCQFLLERGSSSYSQLLAASTLSKLVVGASGSLSLQSKLDIRNYVLAYLMNRLKLAPFVVQALIQLLAKLTKFGWFDSQNDQFPFRDITDNVSKFLQGSMEHCVIGIKTLAELVSHMNQCEGSLSLSKNRKISSSFRDVSLHSIFTMSLDMLRQVSSKQVDFQDQMQLSLMRNLLQLVKNCLAFDFIGTSFDEATDDMGTVHVPTTWKQLFLDFSILHLFLDLYFAVPSSLSPLALANYVQLASVRRSLFDTNERAKYLQELANGVKRILEAPQIEMEPNTSLQRLRQQKFLVRVKAWTRKRYLLEDHENYHEFCRLLARLKANYQLGEIIKVDGYREMMESVTKFTVTSLRMLHFAPNSVYYLLNLWQKMVASCPFIKASDPHLLERFTPQVTEAYISSRLESVTEVIRDGIEDPLNDRATLHQQLDQISTIARCEYPKTCNYLLSLFERAAQSYQELLSTASPSSQDVALQEGRLAWLVYIIGYCVGGRISFSSTDEHDSLDGELCCRILQLMNLTDLKLPQGGSEKLELALLAFLEQFRKIYVGDQINKSSKVYQVMSERVGIPDETTVLSVFVGKIITNMKYWARSDAVTDATLNLLNDLSVGFSSVRKLVKLDAVQFLLKNHTRKVGIFHGAVSLAYFIPLFVHTLMMSVIQSIVKPDHFPFLGSQGNSILKCRTLFYTALGRLLLADLGDEDDRFDAFIMPITATLETLSNLLSNGNANSVQVDEAKHLTIGICRDLRGLAFAFTTKTSFLSFFSWLYPQYTSTILRSLELWYHDPSVTTPILTLFTEMTQNRSQRLMFDVMSPNGVLLFREISKVLVAYGSRILSMNAIPADKLYALKYKGVSLCFNMLKASLSGGYVNFGVLRLYGDDAIDNALRIFVKILLSIPHSDLLEFPKLSTSYYNLIEIISQDHIDQVCNMDAQIFLYILSSVSEGLSALDLAISTCCCATLDHIVTYLFQELHKVAKVNNPQKQNEHPALKVMEMRPEILQQMLSTVLNVVMFEECRNLWSMSRPLLGLILLNEKFFTELERTITEMQPIDKQAGMTQCLTDLMDNVERSLATKNRDRFTQNLSSFRNAVKNLIGSAPSSQSSIPVVEMMGYDM